MKRTLTIFGLVSISILLLGFRGSGYRGDRTLSGDYTFSDAIDVDSLDTDHLVVNDTIILGDHLTPVSDTTSYFGSSTKRAKKVWGLRLMGTDGTKADTFKLYDDGTYTYLSSDNNIQFKGAVEFSNSGLYQPNDTTKYCGFSNHRWKEVWGLRLQWSDGTAADSGMIFDDGTNSYLEIDNADFKIITGTDTVSVGGGAITGTKLRGTDTFDATQTSDTVLITGAGASDYYYIQIKGATVTTSPFTYTAAAGSLIVFCAEGDTSVARASGYNWLRFE